MLAWALLCGASVALTAAGPASAAAGPASQPDPTAPDGADEPEATAAVSYEWDIAKKGTRPPGLECESLHLGPGRRTQTCFEPHGDKIWVLDDYPDGKSATGAWNNYLNGSLYRRGACVNKLGDGEWGVCNKNFYEPGGGLVSEIDLYACNYETEDNTWHGCSSGRTISTG